MAGYLLAYLHQTLAREAYPMGFLLTFLEKKDGFAFFEWQISGMENSREIKYRINTTLMEEEDLLCSFFFKIFPAWIPLTVEVEAGSQHHRSNQIRMDQMCRSFGLCGIVLVFSL